MLKLTGLLLAVLAVTHAAPVVDDVQFTSYMKEFGKSYATPQEQQKRMAIYAENVQKINEHNARHKAGEETFVAGINRFTDMTNEEFRAQMNGYRRPNNVPRNGSLFLSPANVQLPDTVDWRTKGYVTDVKDQKQCGSCWAFSATGSLEGQHFKKTGKLVSLSEQNLVDCSGDEGNDGCHGGWMDQAFEYIKKNDGIDTEESYPYEARDGKCRFKKENVGATLTGYTDIPTKNEAKLQEAVATVGPVSVAIDAGHFSFQIYSHGVYTEKRCSQTVLDHGVLAVGYGTEGDMDYWLVKNSWNTDWGDQGYIKMRRNHNNMCGIATAASYPLV